jgi:hypothetical protein
MPKMARRVGTSFESDLAARTLFTFLAAIIGQLITTWQGWDKWWALAIAAGFTAVRAALESLSNDPSQMLSWSFWERTLWTVAQLALATLTIDSMDGVPLTYAPFVAAAIAALKSYVAPHVGAPTAALGVPADKDTAPRIDAVGVPGPVGPPGVPGKDAV